MKKSFNAFLFSIFFLILNAGQGFSQSTSTLVFDQVSSQFITVNKTLTIPIGVTSLSGSAQASISLVAGLSGVSIQHVTSTSTLGRRAAENLSWTPTTAGQYTCQVTAVDNASGDKSTTSFYVFVRAAGTALNSSPIISPLGMRQVVLGSTVNIPVDAHRPLTLASNPVMAMNIIGLNGLVESNYYATSTVASALITWKPTATGVYFLEVIVSDADGANTTELVPIVVVASGADIAPLIFDQISTAFINVNNALTIPVGITSVASNGKADILSVTGLPGATLARVTSNSTLGPRAAANLSWTPTAAGLYTCQIAGIDRTTGDITNASFYVFVKAAGADLNVSPMISPIGMQKLVLGDTLNLPVNVARPSSLNVTPVPVLALGIGGLNGIKVLNYYTTATVGTAIASWTPTAAGLYYLNIDVADANGADTMEVVPVKVTGAGADYAPLIFDQLSTSFINVNKSVTIPIGVSTSNTGHNIAITSVSGLPGVSIDYLTSTTSLGPRAAANLTWKPTVAGLYICQIAVTDNTSGISSNASFYIFVEPAGTALNVSPLIGSIGAQKVAVGGTMVIPISATRPYALSVTPAPKMSLGISGLNGLVVSNYYGAQTIATATATWKPTVAGYYYMYIAISDAYGANTTEQIPVTVTS